MSEKDQSLITANTIYPISISDLIGKTFFIPSYQRGYRWTRRQVRELLNDINEFIANGARGIYCIQPLVVKRNKNKWDVIDGQQRLTTINLILSCLELEKFEVEYETRRESQKFLKYIMIKVSSDADANIDFYHMYQAREEIKGWVIANLFGTKCFKMENHVDKITLFKEVLLNKVKFILYNIDKEEPITVFTRLNVDKIALTPSELIKALFLNRTNFTKGDSYEIIHLRQQEIANQWDSIENQLQDDNFWLFFHDNSDDTPTRIDYIFRLICDNKLLGEPSEDIGSDETRIFRYFCDFFSVHGFSYKTVEKAWDKVKTIFNTINEWYSDLELYHYVGFLMSRPNESTRTNGNAEQQEKLLNSYLMKWNEDGITVLRFKDYLKTKIQDVIKGCNNVDMDYEKEHCPSKTACRPLLLLHNIQTVINQGLITKNNYRQRTFNKFPFNLYKKEKWDVEHIDSNTENELTEFKDQKEWLVTSYLIADDIQQKAIKDFLTKHDINTDEHERQNDFNKIKESILPLESRNLLLDGNEDKNEKNRIWNFTLLDESTNRGYGNAIFPAKRRTIIGKEQGLYYPCPTYSKDKGFIIPDSQNATSAYILPCTKQAFMKYYSPNSAVLTAWTKDDAKAYRMNILQVLTKAGFTITTNIDEQ